MVHSLLELNRNGYRIEFDTSRHNEFTSAPEASDSMVFLRRCPALSLIYQGDTKELLDVGACLSVISD